MVGPRAGLRVGLGLAMLAAVTVPAIAEPAAPANRTAAATTPTTPDVGDAASAAVTAARWLRAFDVPSPDDAAARIALRNGSAVRVGIRARGRLIADVDAAVPLFGEAAVDEAAVEAARSGLLRRATGRAMAAALGDRVVGALRDTLGDAFGSRLTLELELAGPLVPLAGRRLSDITMQIEPGLDGIALRWEDRVAMAFPARMAADATASNLGRALPALAGDLGLPVESYASLRERFGVRLYRFRTLHFVQRRPGDVPSPRLRGQEIVATAAIRTPTLVAAGRDQFNHLVSHLWATEEPLGLRGDYDAGLDGYRPAIAPSREQALVAYAMARWAGAPGIRPDDRMRAADAAVVVLEELRVAAAGEAPPLEDPVTAAAIVLAESELDRVDAGSGPPPAPPLAPAGDLTDPAGDDVAATDSAVPAAESRADLLALAATDVTVLVATLAATADSDRVATVLAPHDRAVLLAAAARHALSPGDVTPNDARELSLAIESLRSSVSSGELVSLMPWLAMAESDLARLTGEPVPASSVDLLRAMRAALEQIQFGAIAAPDLEGGFALTDAPIPLAGAQSVRPAVLLAWMLGQPHLTPADELVRHRARLRAAMRFIRQLAVRDADLWAIRGSSRAIGGLRSATWDLRMPLSAQAMGLLAYAETLIAIDASGPLESR